MEHNRRMRIVEGMTKFAAGELKRVRSAIRLRQRLLESMAAFFLAAGIVFIYLPVTAAEHGANVATVTGLASIVVVLFGTSAAAYRESRKYFVDAINVDRDIASLQIHYNGRSGMKIAEYRRVIYQIVRSAEFEPGDDNKSLNT